MRDLEEIDIGMVSDMLTEHTRDSIDYPTIASQEDMDRF